MKQNKFRPQIFTKKHIAHPENAKFNSRFKHEMLQAKKEKIRKVKIVLLVTALLTTQMGIATILLTNKQPKEQQYKEENISSEIRNNQNHPEQFGNKILFDDGKNMMLVRFGDKYYYTCSTEYAMSLAQNSLRTVEKTLKTVDGITPVATDNGDFYPDYLNEYLLTAMALCESSFRIADSNGIPLTSKDNALGMMQIRPQTLQDVNNWLKNTMGLNIQYSLEDLSDPQKSMDIATFILVQICKNHGKEHCNNPIYPYLKEEFSLSRQKEIVLALYNNGYDNMIDYAKEGTIFDYLSEGSKDNYVNKISRTAEQLEEKFSQLD